MASNELQQLRSQQQLAQLSQHRRFVRGQHDLKATKSVTKHQSLIKRKTKCMPRNTLNLRKQWLAGQRLRFDSLGIWLNVLLILCLCHHEVVSEGHVGKSNKEQTIT